MASSQNIVVSRLNPGRVVVFAVAVVIGVVLLPLVGFGLAGTGWTGIALKAGSVAACGLLLWACAGFRYRVVIDCQRRCATWYSLRVPQGREVRLDDYTAYRVRYMGPDHYGNDGAGLYLIDTAGKSLYLMTLTSYRNGGELEKALGLPRTSGINKKSTR